MKTGQHFIFAIINLLLTIKCIIFDSVSKILFIFFIANNNNNYDSNIKNKLLHDGYKIINLRYPTYMYQFIIFLIITKIECWPFFQARPEKEVYYILCFWLHAVTNYAPTLQHPLEGSGGAIPEEEGQKISEAPGMLQWNRKLTAPCYYHF